MTDARWQSMAIREGLCACLSPVLVINSVMLACICRCLLQGRHLPAARAAQCPSCTVLHITTYLGTQYPNPFTDISSAALASQVHYNASQTGARDIMSAIADLGFHAALSDDDHFESGL